MSWYSIFKRNREERRIARENAETYKLIRKLPEEVQKDIGWPSGTTVRSRHTSYQL